MMKSRRRVLLMRLGAASLVLALVLPLCAAHAAAEQTTPAVVPIYDGVTPLTDFGVVRYRYDDGRTGEEPLDWEGHSDPNTGIVAEPFSGQNGKSAFLLHPVWRNGIGNTDQVYRVSLPQAKHIALKCSVALWDGPETAKSDGVTFRFFVDAGKAFEVSKTDATWTDKTYDLTPYAGKTVTLTFETDPGPKRDPSFDFALWGDRRIEVEGSPATQPARQWQGEAPLTAFTHGWGGASPTHPASGPGRPPITAQFGTPTKDFLSGCAFSLPVDSKIKDRWVPFGRDAHVELVAADGRVVSSDDPQVAITVAQTKEVNRSVTRTVRYRIGMRTITLHVTLEPYDGSSVRVHVQSSDPYLAAVHFGRIHSTAYSRWIDVPYLGQVHYDLEQRLFFNVIIDYTKSQGSTLDGTTANYLPLVDGRRNPLDETAYYAVSPNIHAVFPTPPNPPSPYRAEMGRRVVLDLWGDPFADDTQLLDDLAGYGLTDFFSIVHMWQHGGYDNQLPDILPANADLGGDQALKGVTAKARSLGERIALHENYSDFYPNAPSYTTADIARSSDGSLIPSWNNGTVQSFVMAPSAIQKYVRRVTPQVHTTFGTNAGYLDVHSAIVPWYHVDYRPNVPNAGKMQGEWTNQIALWKTMRQVHGGPVLGEGRYHWYWSGLLDGVEAQFALGQSTGESAPLFVDFDLQKIHPKQINHGMGYLERWLQADVAWLPAPSWKLDEYRMQEIAYGHSGFVAAHLTSDLGFIWQEHNLVVPAARSYATAQATSVQYDVDGRLVGTDQAIAAGTNFDRVQVTYDNGTRVWANSRAKNWTIPVGHERLTLPQYGWLVESPTAVAYTATRSGQTVDYSETAHSIFASARPPVHVTEQNGQRITPAIAKFSVTGTRSFTLVYRWALGEQIPSGYQVFIHITGGVPHQDDDVALQTPSGIDKTPDQWPVGTDTVSGTVPVSLPPDLPNGEYEIKAGMYFPGAGVRLVLRGEDDGVRRYVLGKFRLTSAGIVPEGNLKVLASGHQTTGSSPIHLGKVIDFGKVATNGSLRLIKERPGRWVLTPFPRNIPFTVAVAARVLGSSHVCIMAVARSGTVVKPVAYTVSSAQHTIWLTWTAGTVPGAARYVITAR